MSSATERPGTDSLEAAAENLETEWPWKRWKAVLYGLAALAAILAAVPLARDYMRYRLATYALFAMGDPISIGLPGFPLGNEARLKVPELFGKHTPDQRLLLFGNLTKSTDSERFKTHWDSDHPTMSFAEYYRTAIESQPFPYRYSQIATILIPKMLVRYMAAEPQLAGPSAETIWPTGPPEPPVHPASGSRIRRVSPKP